MIVVPFGKTINYRLLVLRTPNNFSVVILEINNPLRSSFSDFPHITGLFSSSGLDYNSSDWMNKQFGGDTWDQPLFNQSSSSFPRCTNDNRVEGQSPRREIGHFDHNHQLSYNLESSLFTNHLKESKRDYIKRLSLTIAQN